MVAAESGLAAERVRPLVVLAGPLRALKGHRPGGGLLDPPRRLLRHSDCRGSGSEVAMPSPA